MENTQPTLPEKTTAMEKAIRMAKEVHENVSKPQSTNVWNQPSVDNYNSTDSILTTAKQIYDWLLTT